MTWLVSAHQELISQRDTVFVWRSGNAAGIIAKGTVLTAPFRGESSEEGKEFEVNRDKFKGLHLLVRLRIDEIFAPPLSRSTMKADVRLAELSIFKVAAHTNFVVTADQAVVIDELLKTHHGGI